MKVTDDDGHEETQVITLTVDPVNDPGSFSLVTLQAQAAEGLLLTGSHGYRFD